MKKRYAIAAALLISMGIFTACQDKEAESKETVQTESTESVVQTEIELLSEKPTEGEEEPAEAQTETLGSRKVAYKKAVSDLLNNHVLPDGIDPGYKEGADMAGNRFAIYDIDKDGREELLIFYVTTDMAGKIETVYDYDEAAGTLYKELSEFPGVIFFDNGIVKADWSHNQGRAGRIWPYTLWKYDKEADVYRKAGMLDAWDKALTEIEGEENPFPDEIDKDGDGLIYYIMKDTYSKDTPVDGEEHWQWYDSLVQDGKEQTIPYQPLTQENIDAIS